MRGVLASVKLVAGSDASVLISGDMSTGKKLIAREIHRLSARKDNPLFVMDFVEMPPLSAALHLFGGFDGGIESRGPKHGVLERVMVERLWSETSTSLIP